MVFCLDFILVFFCSVFKSEIFLKVKIFFFCEKKKIILFLLEYFVFEEVKVNKEMGNFDFLYVMLWF